MLLSYNSDAYEIPQSSTCYVHTTGTISDGDTITVTSPVFASVNFVSGAINMSETFSVPVKVENKARYIINTMEPGEMLGTLRCFGNNVFDMYVILH